MRDRIQFQLDMLVFTIILLFFFCMVLIGFLIGVLVGSVSLPAEIVAVFPFLMGAMLILLLGVALTTLLYWSIQVAPPEPTQALSRILVTYSIKRSSRMDRRKSS